MISNNFELPKFGLVRTPEQLASQELKQPPVQFAATAGLTADRVEIRFGKKAGANQPEQDAPSSRSGKHNKKLAGKLRNLLLLGVLLVSGCATSFARPAPRFNPTTYYNGAIAPEERVDNLLERGLSAWGTGVNISNIDIQQWNDIAVLMRISDDTLAEVPRFEEVNDIRIAILERIVESPRAVDVIPQHVIETAIYSAGIAGMTTDDAKLKADLADALMPFIDYVVVTKLSNHPDKFQEYELVTVDEVIKRKKDGERPIVIDYRPHALVALARIAEPSVIEDVIKELDALTSGRVNMINPNLDFIAEEIAVPSTSREPDPEDIPTAEMYATQLMRLLLEAPTDVDMPQVEEMALEWIYQQPVSELEDMSQAELQTFEAVEKDKQLLYAQAINFLAKRGNDMVRPALEQWFNHKRASLHPEADAMVMEALALEAKEDPAMFDVLMRALATQPRTARLLLYNVEGTAENVLLQGPWLDAHNALVDVLRENPEEVHELVLDLYNEEAKLLPDAVVNKTSARNTGRTLAVMMMASDRSGRYNEYLRELVAEVGVNNNVAVAGLGYSQDTEALETLFEYAVREPRTHAYQTQLALEMILQITGPSEIPAEFEDEVNAQSIFSPVFMSEFSKLWAPREAAPDEDALSGWAQAFNEEFETWLAEETQYRDSARQGGTIVEPVSQEEMLVKAQQILAEHLGDGSNSLALRELSNDPEFVRKYLMPMESYLRNSGRHMELGLALPMMAVLRNSHSDAVAPLFADMATRPEKYSPDARYFGFFGPMLAGQIPSIIKLEAIAGLGATVDPTSPDVQILHNILKDPELQHQVAGIHALAAMGQNINSRDEVTPEQRAALQEHIDGAFASLERNEQQFTTKHQSRRVRDYLRYETAVAIDAMGGREQLLERAEEAWKADPNSAVARSFVHALVANGMTPEMAEEMGYKAEMIRQYAGEGFWLGKDNGRHADTPGGEHANFDVGFATNQYLPQYPFNEMNVQYPEEMNPVDPDSWSEPHSSATAALVDLIANDPTIWSFHVNQQIPLDPTRGDLYADGMIYYLEKLVQMQATGETNVVTANYSIGYRNMIWYLQNYREEMVDLISAYMQALADTGVTNVVSAGNAQGGDYNAAYDPVKNQNGLGSRTDDDGRVIQPPSTILSSAIDGLSLWLAEFSSTGNPLREDEALEMFGAPGYRVSLLAYGEGDGTSFSAPNITGIIHRAKMIRAKLGLDPLTHEQLVQTLRNASGPLPGRDEVEAGRYVDPVAWFREIMKPDPTQSSSTGVVWGREQEDDKKKS